MTLDGSTSGLKFAAPYGLATDPLGTLYVADVNNARVVAFSNTGAYVATMNVAAGYQPYGVCVSKNGVVGVADRATGGGNGDVEFFTNYTFSAMTGRATGILKTFIWCAFDSHNNFFADGTAIAGGQEIVYLNKANVNMPGQAILASALGTGTYWEGMYVQKNYNSLSVGGSVTGVFEMQNFHINPNGRPVPVPAIPPTVLNGYPAGSDPFYQAAPSAGAGAGTIYVGDFGASLIQEAPVGGPNRPGGAVTTFNALTAAIGVATHPTGQY